MKHIHQVPNQVSLSLPELNLPAVTGKPLSRTRLEFYSKNLNTHLRIDIFLPENYQTDTTWQYPLLLANDGIDMEAIALAQTTADLAREGKVHPLIIVAVHSTRERKLIYGVAGKPDYADRGNKADAYSLFLMEELLPWIKARFRIINNPAACGIMGFSLGGLMAMDIAWSHSDVFGRVGVFSGSFWWRSKGYDAGYTDADRIMIGKIKETEEPPTEMLFWIQTGTLDEKNDRDKDGIIDSIGDALDLIHELHEHGIPEQQITYVEISEGEHNQATWKLAYPHFLQTLFRRDG